MATGIMLSDHLYQSLHILYKSGLTWMEMRTSLAHGGIRPRGR